TTQASILYDDAGRKVGETITYPSGFSWGFQYGHSLAGKKTSVQYPDGFTIGHEYAAHGQRQATTVGSEGGISVNRVKWPEPDRITLPGGTTRELALDGLLQLEDMKVRRPGQQMGLTLTNQRGKLQELVSAERTDVLGADSSTQTSTFGYD